MLHRLIVKVLSLLPKRFIWLFSKRYIAGVKLHEALGLSNKYKQRNMYITFDILGEHITSMSLAEKYKLQYISVIEQTANLGINVTYSLKPSMFGMLIDKDDALLKIREIVAKAAKYGKLVRLDMEDSPYTQTELDYFASLHAEFPNNVGIVIQSYLKRSVDDIKYLTSNFTPLNVRLCKGIYIEPKEVAYTQKADINKSFIKCLELLLKNKSYVGIATHNDLLINTALQLLQNNSIDKSLYEFQMLYGVRPRLRDSLVSAHHPLRLYLPFGEEWLSYSLRRLNENPQMVWHIIKSLFWRG